MPRTATQWLGVSARRCRGGGDVSTGWPSSAAVYLPHGAPPQPRGGCSATRRSPQPIAASLPKPAAATRERQIESARAAWYRGFVAEAVDRFCRHEKVLDASGRRHSGLLTGDDLARWEAPVEAPLTFDYHDYTVMKGGPWSQGPVLLQQLALLQGFDLDDLDPWGADFVHLVVECQKLAFADREAWYGDPDFVERADAHPARLRLQRREAKAGVGAGFARAAPGSPDGRAPRVARRRP